jgi:alkyl sulfatase BDS1-like metallo-beta-lactamase superfamily hydrolase
MPAPAVMDSALHLAERLVHTPARRLVLDALFWRLPHFIGLHRASGINSSIRWRVTGRPDGVADEYRLDLSDGRCRVSRGPDGPPPALTITLEAAELIRLAARQSDPVAALFTGRVTVTGNMMVAAKLGALFLNPAPREGRR